METVAEIKQNEEQLRKAMLNGDVAQLDHLLSNELIFTNQDGVRLTKADDIAAHQSGLLAIDMLLHQGELVVRAFSDIALVSVTTAVTGKYAGEPFDGVFAYSRIWCRAGGHWQVELAHCSPASSLS